MDEGPVGFGLHHAFQEPSPRTATSPHSTKLLKNEKRRPKDDVFLTLVSKQLRKTNPTGQI
jgi:hypothetical protein